MKKNSIILYANQWGALERLTNEQLGSLFRALFLWMDDQAYEVETREDLVKLAFQFLTLQITIDNEKYLQSKDRRIKYRMQKKKQKVVKSDSQSDNDARARKDVDVNVDGDVDEDVDEDVDKDVDGDGVVCVSKDTTLLEPPPHTDTQQTIMNFIKFWNDAIEQTGSSLKRVKVVSPERRSAIMEIVRRFPGRDAATAIYNAMRSDFCNGRTKRRSRPVEFDWLLKPENFTAALEGNL